MEGGLFLMKSFSTREFVYMSFLVALNIVLSRIASIRISVGMVEGIRIGFGGFPAILAGIMFGPIAGGIVGAMGDALGYYINPMGPYVPFVTLSAALTGVIPPLILRFFKGSKQPFWQLIIAIGIGQIITSILLTPYILQLAFNIPFFVTLPARIVSQLINVPIYTILIGAIERTSNITMGTSSR